MLLNFVMGSFLIEKEKNLDQFYCDLQTKVIEILLLLTQTIYFVKRDRSLYYVCIKYEVVQTPINV